MTSTDRPDFGRKTGRHTHPVTHPLWLEFADDNCIVCGTAGAR